MSVPYSVNQGNLKISIERFSNIYYVAGQGGVIILSGKLQAVTNAGVLGVQSNVGTVAYNVSVVNTGLSTGTVGTQTPQTNGIQIYVQQISGGVVAEAPTGTLNAVITLLVEGN
jgi:hypothetical protein